MTGLGELRLAEYKATDLNAEVEVPKDSNKGLTCPNSAFLRKRLGEPREDYTQECQPATNQTLKDLMKSVTVGPIKVKGLGRAVDSLKLVIDDIQKEQPKVYAALGTVGMLCCRKQRPAKGQDASQVTAISSHSWGTAIDLTIHGKLDVRGNGTTQRGVAQIAPIFNRHGWFWGATFRTEDAMHFEVSREKLSEWFPTDLYDHKKDPAPGVSLRHGSRGDLVLALQKRLQAMDPKLIVDGIFGKGTEAAVRKFQEDNGLKPDGVVGPKTRKAMGL